MAKAAVRKYSKSRPLSPDTTEQEDITFAGQRKVNLIWERTQSFIAVLVVVSNMTAGVTYAILGKDTSDYPFVLSSSLFLVIGFYFSRTNHQAVGGVGKKPPVEKYTGR